MKWDTLCVLCVLCGRCANAVRTLCERFNTHGPCHRRCRIPTVDRDKHVRLSPNLCGILSHAAHRSQKAPAPWLRVYGCLQEEAALLRARPSGTGDLPLEQKCCAGWGCQEACPQAVVADAAFRAYTAVKWPRFPSAVQPYLHIWRCTSEGAR